MRARYWFMVMFVLVTLVGCGSGSSGDQPPEDDPVLPRSDVRGTDQLVPYRADGPYATVLKQCVLADSVDDACTLSQLPFLAQDTSTVTVNDVMNRLVVTHEWMGERFEALLVSAPSSLVSLFGSITAISIGSTIRPSYYWTGTGAIHIDPNYLWLSTSEKATIATAEDFRSGYGADLQYWFFSTLRNGNRSIERPSSLTDYNERTFADTQLPVYRLLYHELGHAVDFLPPESVASLDTSLQPWLALEQNQNYFLSPRLVNELPLYSQQLFGLAQVSFKGAEATPEQLNATALNVGTEMSTDGAMRYYGYSTVREDFATLFAMTMMKASFNLDYYMAYVQKPIDQSNYGCDDVIVGWGQKNRLGDNFVLPRAQWVVEHIYGMSAQITDFFNSGAGQTQQMVTGADWCSNLNSDVQAKTTDSLEDAYSSFLDWSELEAQRAAYQNNH